MTLKDFLSQNDRFAANSGCRLTDIHEGHQGLTFGIENNIMFLHSAKAGDTLPVEGLM